MYALLLSAAFALAADCPHADPVSPDALRQRIQQADRAWMDLDADSFLRQLDELKALLPCVERPISPALAAELHRREGLYSFLNHDPEAAEAAFASARAVEPDYSFPEAMVPEGNPVLSLYVARDPNASPAEELARPALGELVLDGRPAASRPLERPVIFQHLEERGVARLTVYLAPGQPVPDYPAQSVAVQSPPEVVPRAGKGLRTGLTALAIASGGLAAVSFGGSHLLRGRYDRATDPEALHRLRGQTNALSAASVGALAVGIGAGGAAVLVGHF